ncbi:tryptophan 7-halogenase [Microbulbifer elongatus]|uniref:Tryptophan 7-halogenase n=1 Tax=Microbulbifer elongatus TaxID=86173 RepID=A0ABT1NWU2_9GAMM|nr:tryptophan halogenase family protein [Microbulbifer elongatus]MCQ3828277.1 tryptophan 7-halogenase [Microbulbifer elongatus]
MIKLPGLVCKNSKKAMSRINIQKVVVVGGGTAGWIAAGLMARKLSTIGVEVHLIEASDVPVIGVGEGTFPTMRHTLQFLGIDEFAFLSECSATFKQGIKFSNWKSNPITEPGYYYHLFDLPAKSGAFDLSYAWLADSAAAVPFAHAVCPQAAICDSGLAPRPLGAKAYSGSHQYAYHLDSGRFIEFLRKHCVEKLGIQHSIATISRVTRGEAGNITSVSSGDGREFAGDFFIDCSGFRALLIGDELGVEFKDVGHQLLTDTALAVQVPYEDPENSPVVSYTHAQAESAGWIWDIGLQARRGIGYVYSQSHTTEDEAYKTLTQYAGGGRELDVRKIPMRVGYRRAFWEKNCVAVGLSAGFVEPLEATAISMIEQSVKMLIERFPTTLEEIPALAKHYNTTFVARWERIVEFIKFHYCISQRDDSDFWCDNRCESTIPIGLQDRLSRWQCFPMEEIDFNDKYEMFGLSSYRYVAYGMGFNLGVPKGLEKFCRNPAMAALQHKVESITLQHQAQLPSHRDLLKSIG